MGEAKKAKDFFFGPILDKVRDVPENLRKLAAENGDTCSFKIGLNTVYMLSHPDYVKKVLVTDAENFHKGPELKKTQKIFGEGLLTSEGEFHRRQRKLAQPVFNNKRIKSYIPIVNQFVDELGATWEEGEEREIEQEMMALTMRIVGKALFNVDFSTEAKDIADSLEVFVTAVNRMTIPFSQLLDFLPLPHTLRMRKARKLLDQKIYGMIGDRRAGDLDVDDLLTRLLNARDLEDNSAYMTDTQLRDELVTIFLAGYETTSKSLAWTFYLLSQYPNVASKLREELDTVLEGRLPTEDNFEKLEYTGMVLNESLRLYPPAWILTRRAVDDYELDGVTIPKNSVVILSQYVVQRDPRFYDDPDSFIPERWSKEERSKRPRFSYFPFGGGARQCIGEGFAWQEGILIVAALLQNWEFELKKDYKLELFPQLTLRPRYGLPMKVKSRH